MPQEPGAGNALSSNRSIKILTHRITTEACLSSVGESCPSMCTSANGVCECVFTSTVLSRLRAVCPGG